MPPRTFLLPLAAFGAALGVPAVLPEYDLRVMILALQTAIAVIGLGIAFGWAGLIQLAQAVIEVTGSRSEIVFEALPVDDPQVRQPDISLARELLGWEPTVELRDGLRRTLEAAGAAALTGTQPA